MPEIRGASSPAKNAPTRFQETMREVPSAQGGGTWLWMVFIPAIGLAVAAVMIFVLSADPPKTLRWFFLGPAQNLYYFGNMINSAVPLIFGGLGVSVALQGGNYNLGGEGQIYSGAFAATAASFFFAPLGIFGAALSLLAGAVFSGALASFSGFCRAKWNCTELITSFLAGNMIVLIVNWLITGPFLDPETNLQTTRKIPELFRLPRILPVSRLDVSVFVAGAAVFLVWFYLYRTRAGYELRMTGFNPVFARYGGINEGATRIKSMFVSGALYGLGGALAVFGTYHATVKEFSSGLGWNGLAVALIAGARPALVIPASLFFAWVLSGARLAMQFSDVTQEIASVVQAVVFFLVTSRVALVAIVPAVAGRKKSRGAQQ